MKVLNKIEADFNDIVASENDIIKNLRVENFGEFRKQGIPTSKEEFWKFTNPSIIKDSEFSLGTSSKFTDNNFDVILVNGKLIKRNEKIINNDITINNIGKNIAEVVQKKSTPFKKPRKSGGSPKGVNDPPIFATRKMKKTII